MSGAQGRSGARARFQIQAPRATDTMRAWARRGLDEPKRCWPLPCVLSYVRTCVSVVVVMVWEGVGSQLQCIPSLRPAAAAPRLRIGWWWVGDLSGLW